MPFNPSIEMSFDKKRNIGPLAHSSANPLPPLSPNQSGFILPNENQSDCKFKIIFIYFRWG